jgi:Holliday junction resolvasome RuvABC endonuclease subunit
LLTGFTNSEFTYHVGIDPGWKNLGICVCKRETETEIITVIHTAVMNPSSFLTISEFIAKLDKVLTPLILHVDSVMIERFVAYAGVSTAETENICMLIGALCFYFVSQWDKEPGLLRAIDWKMNLVKALVTKKGFDNPSSKLDKKFSMAAALASVNVTIPYTTDHEGDAVCLAAYPLNTKKD